MFISFKNIFLIISCFVNRIALHAMLTETDINRCLRRSKMHTKTNFNGHWIQSRTVLIHLPKTFPPYTDAIILIRIISEEFEFDLSIWIKCRGKIELAWCLFYEFNTCERGIFFSKKVAKKSSNSSMVRDSSMFNLYRIKNTICLCTIICSCSCCDV